MSNEKPYVLQAVKPKIDVQYIQDDNFASPLFLSLLLLLLFFFIIPYFVLWQRSTDVYVYVGTHNAISFRWASEDAAAENL